MQIYDLTLVVQTGTFSRKSVTLWVGKSNFPQPLLFLVLGGSPDYRCSLTNNLQLSGKY